MKLLKASKFHCSFKGLAKNNSQDPSNAEEFNHDESIITAFSFEDALSQWLTQLWDLSLSISVPSNLGDDNLNYGETYEDFISSNAVEFNMIESDKNHIIVEIKYKGRGDFFYEIKILSSAE